MCCSASILPRHAPVQKIFFLAIFVRQDVVPVLGLRCPSLFLSYLWREHVTAVLLASTYPTKPQLT